MADTSVAVTPGSGAEIDFRSEGTNGDLRQVVVIGDPAINAGVAPVDAANGLSVSVTNTTLAATQSGTWNVTVNAALPAGTNNIGDVDVLTVPADPFGANADAAATAGSTGSMQAKFRLMTSQLDAIKTALEIMDDWDSSDAAKTVGFGFNIATDITRPADTTAYAANDCLSDSTSAPTTFTFTNAGRISGGSGIITDLIVVTDNDPATTLQGEIWLFPASVTSPNDNAAFALSDADMKTCIGKIPFALEDAGNNGFAHISGLNIAYTCSGSANLRFLVRVKNAYTPASAEVITVRIAGIQTT